MSSLFLLYPSSSDPARSALTTLLVDDVPLRTLQLQSTAMLWGLAWTRFDVLRNLIPIDDSWRFDRDRKNSSYYDQVLKAVTALYSDRTLVNDSLGYLEFALISAFDTWGKRAAVRRVKEDFFEGLSNGERDQMNPHLLQLA